MKNAQATFVVPTTGQSAGPLTVSLREDVPGVCGFVTIGLLASGILSRSNGGGLPVELWFADGRHVPISLCLVGWPDMLPGDPANSFERWMVRMSFSERAPTGPQ